MSHGSVVQDITNGSKHFDLKASQQTKAGGGFDSAAFDRDAFDTQRLEVEVEVLGERKWVPADILIETVVKFWRDFFREYSPYDELPAHPHLTEFK
jgi:hypothetical protein